jgi:hypothetical protein
MSKKLLTTLTIIIVIFSAVFIAQVSSETINQPQKLKLAISPPSIPSDNTTATCIFVQLQDSDGLPARAAKDTTISLSSSSTEIGSVDSTLTIKSGDTYATANFSSTFTPGQSIITAAATGYETVQSPITTVGPKPYTVAVYGFPSTLPADGQTYQAVMVQLQDSTGSPAKAPNGGSKVTLSCSNTSVGEVTPTVTIMAGQTYALADFTTKGEGTAAITPVASDYTSKSTMITTSALGLSSNKLSISTGPSKVLADNVAYRQVVVQLIDESGNLGIAADNVNVTIASNDQSIGTTEPQITIIAGQNYALATFSTTYKAGTAILTAAATNYTAATQTINTIGYTASKLAVYCTPASLPSDNGAYQSVQVQLQDASGRPAKSPSDLTVNLFSSQPSVAVVSPNVQIAMGQTCTTGTLTVTKTAGEATVTAQASSYVTAQATLKTHKIDLSPLTVTVTAQPSGVYYGNTTQVTAYLSSEGNPVTGADVEFTSNSNGTFTSIREDGAGYYRANYTTPTHSPLSSITISASASAVGCLTVSGTTRVAVSAPPAPVTNATAASLAASTIVMRVIDVNGDPVADAQVSTETQPAGIKQLSGTTNQSGCVTFNGTKTGYYAFSITKEGYRPLSQSFNFTGKTATLMLTPTPADNTMLIIAPIVAVILIVAIAVTVVKRRRRGSSKNRLQPLNWPMPS